MPRNYSRDLVLQPFIHPTRDFDLRWYQDKPTDCLRLDPYNGGSTVVNGTPWVYNRQQGWHEPRTGRVT